MPQSSLSLLEFDTQNIFPFDASSTLRLCGVSCVVSMIDSKNSWKPQFNPDHKLAISFDSMALETGFQELMEFHSDPAEADSLGVRRQDHDEVCFRAYMVDLRLGLRSHWSLRHGNKSAS